jgi:anti-anti-sigma factor
VSGTQPPPFSLEISDADGRTVIAARGELDLATAPALEDALLPRLRDGRHAIIDLRDLQFMDSSGVRVLIAAHHAAQERGGRLSLVRLADGSPIQRVLEISGLDAILDLIDHP